MLNAKSAMLVTLAGIVMLGRLVHTAMPTYPMFIRLGDNVRLARFAQ